jgi:hypothetical protein
MSIWRLHRARLSVVVMPVGAALAVIGSSVAPSAAAPLPVETSAVARDALARGGARGSSHGFRQLPARMDIELSEYLPQMPFDRAAA